MPGHFYPNARTVSHPKSKFLRFFCSVFVDDIILFLIIAELFPQSPLHFA